MARRQPPSVPFVVCRALDPGVQRGLQEDAGRLRGRRTQRRHRADRPAHHAPALPLTGHVNLVGGSHDVDIEHITLSLVTRVEVESGDGEHAATGEFHRVTVSGPLRLAEGQQLSLPFQIVMPWETPITTVYGQVLHGMTMGVRTEVSIAKAVDKGDLDPVYVHPLPVQQRILDAFAQLGFRFKNADLEYGQIAGVHQTLPFYQEIEYFPAAAVRARHQRGRADLRHQPARRRGRARVRQARRHVQRRPRLLRPLHRRATPTPTPPTGPSRRRLGPPGRRTPPERHPATASRTPPTVTPPRAMVSRTPHLGTRRPVMATAVTTVTTAATAAGTAAARAWAESSWASPAAWPPGYVAGEVMDEVFDDGEDEGGEE